MIERVHPPDNLVFLELGASEFSTRHQTLINASIEYQHTIHVLSHVDTPKCTYSMFHQLGLSHTLSRQRPGRTAYISIDRTAKCSSDYCNGSLRS